MPRYSVNPPLGLSHRGEISFGSPDGEGDPIADRVLLGKLNEAGSHRKVYIDLSRESVTAFFGKRGSGKSYSLGALAEGLCTREPSTSLGACSRRKAILLFDALNIFWTTANPLTTATDRDRFPRDVTRLRSWDIEPPELDAEVFVPAGYRSEGTPQSFVDFTLAEAELSSDDLHHLVDADPDSPMGALLVESWEKSAQSPTGRSFGEANKIIEADPDIARFYVDSTRRAVRQRLNSLMQSRIFDPQGTPLRRLLNPGRLSIIEMGDVDDRTRTVVVSALLRRIHRERQRTSGSERQLALNTRLAPEEVATLKDQVAKGIPPTFVMIDEAQNVFPSERTIKSSESVVRFVREGRNFGLSFALTTQQPSAVDNRILAQADTVICHQLTVQNDIARTRDNLKCAEPYEVKVGDRVLDLAAWLRSLGQGQAIVANTDVERVFAIEVRPRVSPHGGGGYVGAQGLPN